MKSPETQNAGPRAASPHCLSGLPTKSKAKNPKKKVHRLIPLVEGPARYDDYVTDCVSISLASTFVRSNADLPLGQWMAPSANAELDAIHAMVMTGHTYDGKSFDLALANNARRLFVGLVEIQDVTIAEVEVEAGKGFGIELMSIPCHRVKVLLAAPACADHPLLEVPVARLAISNRKFSLPKGNHPPGKNHVSGPYLAIAAYEPDSRVIARVRLFPVWYSAGLQRMLLVRSGLERTGAEAFAVRGAIAFTFVSRKQLPVLQAGLGHRWLGNLNTYEYQPDYVPMPMVGHKAIVAELFGVRAIKRYDAAKRRKKVAGEQNPDITFVYVEGAQLTAPDVTEWVETILANPANGIWTRAKCASIAA